MVKNIPTIERSTKIRFGKHATDDQGENTIVFNASNVAIDTSVPGSVYMTPLRQQDDITSRDITMLTYNTETKEVIDSNVPAVDLFTINLQYATNNDNVTSNTVRFINDTTSFVTTGNVGIQNINPTHALDVGSKFHVTEGGEVRVGPSVLIDSDVNNKIQVSGRIDTDSITVDHIGLSNNTPTITGLSLGSSTFLQHPSESINAFSTTGNVSAAFYHGDSYYLSNLNLNNIVLQGNTTSSRTVQFNYANGPALITNGNVGIQNTHGIHTLDVGSNLFVDDIGSNILVVTGNTFTSRKALVGSNLVMDTLGSNIIQVTGNTYTSRKALVGSNLVMDAVATNVVEVTGNTYTSRKALIGSNVTIDTLGTNVVEVTGNTYTSRKALIGSNVTIDTLGSNVIEVTGNTYTSRKALIGSNVTIDTLGSNVIEVTGNTYTSRKALIGSNVTIDTLGSNVIEVTGNTYTSRKALIGSNVTIDTLGSNVVEVTGNVNVSNYTKTDYITVQKDAHIKGNLTVEGTTTTIDTVNTTFEDAVISLANNNESAATDIGIIMKQPDSNANPTITFRGDEKEMMIGYTLNNSLDTEIVPDLSNVIDLHVYGNVIAQNNITLTSGELTAITLNGNVIGNNVNAITLSGNVVGNNANVITLRGNVVADNVYVTNNIETTSGFFKGDGSILSNVTLQQVTKYGNTTSNTVQFTNAHTAFTTDLTSNVGVKLGQLSNVIITSPDDHKSLLYIDGNWIDDYVDFTSIEVKAGETLSKGDVVYIHDGLGDTPEVKKADSSSASTMPAIGIVMDGTINLNDNGHVVTFGTFGMAFNTNFQKGEILYVSNTTPGELMNTVPFSNTDKIQNVGIVVKSGSKILVTGVGRSNDIPNAEEVYAQPTYVYVNSSGNELKKILASNLSANNQTLDMVTSWSNSTQNTIQSTHATTGFISSGNVHVGSNIFVSGIKDPLVNGLSYIPMIEKGTGKLIRSPVYVANDDTYVINAANAEFTGNLSFTGNTYVFESNTVTIEDRVLGIANNNASHTLDVGIIMGHPEHNIAFIHHGAATGDDPHEHVMTLGYTQNTVADNHVLDDLSNLITFQVIGNVIVQNNLTITSGDLTAITVNSNVVGDNVSVITLNGNVVADNVVATNMYGTIAGSNTINASTISAITTNSNVVADNVVATNMYGTIAGANTISASTIYVGTGSPTLGDWELRVEGDTEITGNLHVGGTTTTVNTENLVVKDPIIQLGDASASVDSGLLLARPSGTDNVYMGYDQSETEFALGFTDNHAGDSTITVKDNVDFALNVHGNVEASYFFGDGSQLSGIQTATPTLASVVDEGNTTSNVVRFTNTTTGIEMTSNIDFVNKITLKSTSATKSNLFVVNAIQLDPSYVSPSNNVLSYDTTTGEIYDSGGLGGSLFDNISEEGANVALGSNLTVNSFGSNVLTVSGNVSADNITIGGLTIEASPFALDDVVSVYDGANVTANVLTLGGLVTSGNVNASNIIVSGNTTSQNIKLTNTDISATISSGTITIDAREKSYGTAPLVVSTTDVSNLVFSNLITGAQIVVPILASGGDINISSAMTNVNFYAMTTDVSVTQDKHALMTLSNLYGNIYMNAIGFA